MKILLIAIGIWFLWYFFHREESLLRWATVRVSNGFLGLLLICVRSMLFGYIVYALTAVYGSIGRISTPADIIAILTARPSALGGPGIVGVILGSLVAFASFSARPTQSPTPSQGRIVSFATRRSTYTSFRQRVGDIIKKWKSTRP